MQRAKDLNGLLTILANATQALTRVVPILNRLPDTESQIQTQDLRSVREDLEMLGRDLTGGVVDLRELPFDEGAWKLNFNDSPLQLAGEPDPKPQAGHEFWPDEVPLVRRTPEREGLFDFESPPVQDLGEAPYLQNWIYTSQPAYDDAPTVPILPDGMEA